MSVSGKVIIMLFPVSVYTILLDVVEGLHIMYLCCHIYFVMFITLSNVITFYSQLLGYMEVYICYAW